MRELHEVKVLVLGHVVVTLPFVLRLTLASLAGVKVDLERASASLGASAFATFRHVTLPLISPGIMAGLVFAFLLSFDETGIAVFTALPGSTTLPVRIFTYAEQKSDPMAAAASAVMMLLAIGAVLLVERSFGLLRLLSGGVHTDDERGRGREPTAL